MGCRTRGDDELRTMVKNGTYVWGAGGERVAVEIAGRDESRREQGPAMGMWARKGGLRKHVWPVKVDQNRSVSGEDTGVRCPLDVPLTYSRSVLKSVSNLLPSDFCMECHTLDAKSRPNLKTEMRSCRPLSHGAKRPSYHMRVWHGNRGNFPCTVCVCIYPGALNKMGARTRDKVSMSPRSLLNLLTTSAP